MTGTIPTHPEATDDPQVVRWVIPLGHLTHLGPVTTHPPPLQALRSSGVIDTITTTPTCVTIALTPDHTWRDVGADVRNALHASLATPDAWGWDTADTPTPPDHVATTTPTDADIATLAATHLAGPGGDYLRSHGGNAHLHSVHHGIITLTLTGACRTCPAASATLHTRLAHDLQRLHPDVVDVRRSS